MSAASRSELQSLLAAEFDRQGWQFDLTIGRKLLDMIGAQGQVDGLRLAETLPAEFFSRNRTSKELVGSAIEGAIGGRSVAAEPTPAATITIDNRYQVNVGQGGQISGSNLNVGDGVQINVDVNASKEDVLTGVEAVLRGGLMGEWNDDAARALASVIESRDDIDFEDVRRVTTEVVTVEQPKQNRVKELLGRIAAGGVAGALGTGLSAGLGELLSQLPI
jgi:hypothetical protein